MDLVIKSLLSLRKKNGFCGNYYHQTYVNLNLMT